MNRYYIPPGEWQDEALALTGDEARHCSRVMRAREGDVIELFDGEGKSAVCTITAIGHDKVSCRVESTETSPPAAHPVTLCQAIPKGGNMELIVQKAVELGVNAIQPLVSARTVARPDQAAKKRAKWQRIALEACKQCGQNHVPAVMEPVGFGEWLGTFRDCETRLVASLDSGAAHLGHYFAQHPPEGSIALLIGPEGDFSAGEYQAAYRAGFQAISFGNIVLRVETAAICGLSIVRHELSALDERE